MRLFLVVTIDEAITGGSVFFLLLTKSLEIGSHAAQGRYQGPRLFELIVLPSLLCGFHPHSCKSLWHLILDRKKGER